MEHTSSFRLSRPDTGSRLLAVRPAPNLRIALAHTGRRVRLELLETGLGPERRFRGPAQRPRRLAGRAVGDVLARGWHQHELAEDAGYELLHGRRPCGAADEQHPLDGHTLRDDRLDA